MTSPVVKMCCSGERTDIRANGSMIVVSWVKDMASEDQLSSSLFSPSAIFFYILTEINIF